MKYKLTLRLLHRCSTPPRAASSSLFHPLVLHILDTYTHTLTHIHTYTYTYTLTHMHTRTTGARENIITSIARALVVIFNNDISLFCNIYFLCQNLIRYR